VIETYGNITVKNLFESGRSAAELPKVDLSTFRDYVKYSKAKGIEFNYTLNSPHMNNKEFTNDGIIKIIMFLNELYDIGIRTLTIAMPPLIEIVRSLNLDFKIRASVISQIATPNKARFITRDFSVLKRIGKAVGGNIEIIANSICFRDCPYRIFHYNQISGDSIHISSKASVNYYDHRCLLRRFMNIDDFLKLSWIRPEDLKYYRDIGINFFKLQGRGKAINGDPARVVECYFNESYDGDLLELLEFFNLSSSFHIPINNRWLDGFIKPFVENETFCKNDCKNCNYCKNFISKFIDKNKVEEISDLADTFFSEYDQFNQIMGNLNKKSDEKIQEIDASFNLD
jgi:collagenase-like PrtC family protease